MAKALTLLSKKRFISFGSPTSRIAFNYINVSSRPGYLVLNNPMDSLIPVLAMLRARLCAHVQQPYEQKGIEQSRAANVGRLDQQ